MSSSFADGVKFERERFVRILQRAAMAWSAPILIWMISTSTGCDSAPVPQARRPDPRVVVHAVEPSSPTPEGLAYMVQMADVMEDAASQSGVERVATLKEALALPVPGGLAEAEILRLEAATALAETMMEQPEGAPVARDLLHGMLGVERSLPMDRVTARALATLGDAAAKTGDDALAAGSYARAVRVMSLLRQELER